MFPPFLEAPNLSEFHARHRLKNVQFDYGLSEFEIKNDHLTPQPI